MAHRGGSAPAPVSLPGGVLSPPGGTGGTFQTRLQRVFMSVFSQMSLHLLPYPEVRVNAELFTGVKKPHTAPSDICFAEMICVCSP